MLHYIKKLFVVFIFILSSTSCKDEITQPENSLIESAYLNNSVNELDSFIFEWYSSVHPTSDSELSQLSDTIKCIYELYKSYYDPLNLYNYSITGYYPETGNNFYHSIPYFIIQNQINYKIGDSDSMYILKDFKPQLGIDSVKFLYLTDKYKNEMLAFLDDPKYRNEWYEIMMFLRQRIKIYIKHYNLSWHLVTFPEIEEIKFNNNLDTAIVSFRILFEGGTSKLIRNSNRWEMIESQLLWIE